MISLIFSLLLVLMVSDKCATQLTLNLDADVGSNITLPCPTEATGNQVRWLWLGKERSGFKNILSNGNLFLSSLQKNDTGIYECGTESDEDNPLDMNNDKFRVNLRVKTPPGPLKNVTVVPSSVLALLQWLSVDDGGYPISHIVVRYREINTKNNKWTEVNHKYITPSVTQMDIYRLNPNTTYLFQVMATNKLGPGEITNITTHTFHDNQEIELARHLLEGAETFDTRVWIAAVIVVMVTMVILTLGTCCVLYYECSIPIRKRMDEDDPEKIELIPNVISNPNYYEDISKWKKIYESNVVEQQEDVFIEHCGKPVRV